MNLKYLIAMLICITMLTSTHASNAEELIDDPRMLETYEWKHRVILLISSKEAAETLATQQEILNADEAGNAERDLKIIQFTPETHPKLSKKYDYEEGFLFILIGKDGGEKMRSQQPVNLEKLYSTIDAMPMRAMESMTR